MNRIKSEVMEITPELAEEWLNLNTHNRPLKQSVVERYATTMQAGQWRLTHQGIAFDDKSPGTLIDGQHRLMAIWWLWAERKARVTIPMMVSWGLPLSSQLAVDDHAKRTAIDVGAVLTGLGGLNSRHLGAARILAIYGYGYDKSQLSNQFMVQFLKKHFEHLDFSVSDVFHKAIKRSITQAPVQAVVAQAEIVGEPPDSLRRFGSILLGERAKDEEVAAHVLRNWLVEGVRSGGQTLQGEIYWKTQRALRSFLDKEYLTRLYEAKDQLFPIPEVYGKTRPKKSRKAKQSK